MLIPRSDLWKEILVKIFITTVISTPQNPHVQNFVKIVKKPNFSISILSSALEKGIQLKWSAPLCSEHSKTMRAKHHFHI